MADRYIPPRILNVIAAVAFEHKVAVDDVLGRSGERQVEMARKEAMRCVRRLTYAGKEPSYPQIGRWFDRHHTTVLHACRFLHEPEQLGLPWAA